MMKRRRKKGSLPRESSKVKMNSHRMTRKKLESQKDSKEVRRREEIENESLRF